MGKLTLRHGKATMRGKHTLPGSQPGGCTWPSGPVAFGRRLPVLTAARAAAVSAIGPTGRGVAAGRCTLRRAEP